MHIRGVSRKQQFNVNLPAELVRRVKHASIDSQLSLSDWLGRLLTSHLEKESAMPERPPLTLQPMVHVEEMAASLDFFTALGATVRHGSRDGDFALLDIGGSQLSLLAHPPNPEQHEGEVELNFEAADLDALSAALQRAGVRVVQPVSDEGFGRQLQVQAPGGLLVKINELEPDLYT